jgi:signal transduction histidine kinase/response regulator RpfG family c-di-GMP phosphodiesterase
MGRRDLTNQGPSAMELKLRGEVDRLRREKSKAAKAGEAAGVNASAGDSETVRLLQQQIAELTETRQRLSKLYFSQVEENRKRGHRLHHILENIGQINSDLDLDGLLHRVAETLCSSLGFRIVLIRTREPGADHLRARACAGIDAGARASLEGHDLPVEEFLSWLRDEFKVSRSYFISHNHPFSQELPNGYAPDLGPREDWEWHRDDVLLVPLFNRTGELVAYFSVDDPVDRLVPSSETIELLEIFGNHAVVAIENARLYGELERQTRALKEAGQRMQEIHTLKRNFVSAVSHELRTPVAAIRGCIDTLRSAPGGAVPPERMAHVLSIINEESVRLARLVESVLELNRFDSGEMPFERNSDMDLAEVVAETLPLLEPMAEAGQLTLKVETAAADTRIDADRDQMRQLVLQLASNAIKFTPAGGTVTLEVTGNEDEVALRVLDTGIGIPAHALDRVFERFYQVDSSLVRRFGGTGLGLALCKTIVEWHGGRVVAESEPGRGSCFTVTLPHRARVAALRPATTGRVGGEELMRLAVEMVAGAMNARVVSVLTPTPTGELVVQAAVGLSDEVIREARVQPGVGVAGWVAEHRRPVCVSNKASAGDVQPSGRTTYRTGTFLSVPLESESEGLLGVLNVTDPVSQEPFEVEDCHLLLQLAGRVVAAWRQVRSMEHDQARLEDAAHTLRHVVQHLERGRRHAPDRGRIARAIAHELKLGDDEAAALRYAASIHDVGMTKVAADLVDRPGALSDDDRAAMRRHVEVGAELLGSIETVEAVREAVRAHHEWFDGSGYPRGLAGEEIPLAARILAVVDAWESITIGRAHRPARSREEALQEIRNLAGRQFDPRVVAALEQALAGAPDPANEVATGPQGTGAADARR